jgi:hypothetical protein
MRVTTGIALGIIGIAAAAYALPAAAVVTTYNLVGAGCSTNNSNYDNVRNCPGVAATGWSNTAGSNLDSARIVAYSGGLGTTNKDGPGGPGGGGDGSEQDSAAPEHAIDNNDRWDSILLNFGAGNSVKLTDVQIGYRRDDSDLTILAFTGGVCASPLGQTYAGLLGCGWTLVSHTMDVPVQGGTNFTSINNTGGTTSQLWLIATRISDAALANPARTFGGIDSTLDHVKLLAVVGDPNGRVPEPSSAALLGIAALGLWRLRRKG